MQSKILFHTDIYTKADLFHCISLLQVHFSSPPFIILEDPFNGSIAVEGVAFFLTVGDLSGTLDGVFGRDAIVGNRDSFLFTAGVKWEVWFSSILVLEGICFSSHSIVFKCGLMWSHVLLSFWLEFSILHQYEWGSEVGSRITAGFHILSSVSKHQTVCPVS